MTTKERERVVLEKAVNEWLKSNSITKLEAIQVKDLPKNYYLDVEDNSLINSFSNNLFIEDHMSIYDPNAESSFLN